jgi:heptosyltransferase II
MQEKVLIIKIGFTEFLVSKTDETVSLGDVVRCTPILHCFQGAHVTWLTDKSCYPFLEGIPNVKRLIHYDLTSVLQLQAEHFDTVVNLEKAPGICALTDGIKAWKRYGFRFNPMSGEVAAYLSAEKVLEISAHNGLKHKSKKTFNEFLFEVVGKRWNGEDYLLGYKPKSKITYDVGFNTKVGSKWPYKAWPQEYWEILERQIKDKYSVSYQQGVSDLYEYMDWIHSCRCIVTNDSLGLHLAVIMKKKVIGLFGPSFANELDLAGMGVKLAPAVNYRCIPCLMPTCNQKKPCMYFISPDVVAAQIKKILKKH